MKVLTAKLVSNAPYSQGRYHSEPEIEGESKDAYDQRTWMYKMHRSERGTLIIPPMAFKNALSEAAKYLSKPIKGKGKSTYTKYIESGLLVLDPLDTGIPCDKVACETLFVPASGKRGDGKRVVRRFPTVPAWEGTVAIHVLEPILEQAEAVVEEHLVTAGSFIGIGRFRPRNNGHYGRFRVTSITWTA